MYMYLCALPSKLLVIFPNFLPFLMANCKKYRLHVPNTSFLPAYMLLLRTILTIYLHMQTARHVKGIAHNWNM